MTDTIKTNENVIPRRRASDWQKPPSAALGNVFDWFDGYGAVILEERARARVSAALNGAKTIADVLMQAAIDREEDDQDSPLRLSESAEQGLLAALASCIRMADIALAPLRAADTRARARSSRMTALSPSCQPNTSGLRTVVLGFCQSDARRRRTTFSFVLVVSLMLRLLPGGRRSGA